MKSKFLAFLAVFLVAFLIGSGVAILVCKNVHVNEANFSKGRLTDRWKLYEDENGYLIVDLMEKDGFAVCIGRQSIGGKLQFIDILKDGGEGVIFEYKAIGDFGIPETMYTAGPVCEGTIWVDLNRNGQFDLRFLGTDQRFLGTKMMQIFVNNHWIRAKKIKDHQWAFTDQGVFRYNTDQAKWVPSDESPTTSNASR